MDKLPSQTTDALSKTLRENLRRRRPWYLGRVFWFVVPLTLLGGFILWWNLPTGQPPRLLVVALDQLSADGKPLTLRGRIEPWPKDAQAVALGGVNVFFVIDRKAQPATSDPFGDLVATASVLPEGGGFTVRHVGTRERPGSEDSARVFAWPADSKLLVVDVEETLAAIAADAWPRENPLDIAPRPDAAAALREAEANGYHIVYFALSGDSALAYRKVRGWMYQRIARKDGFPAGPVLGRLSYHDQTEPRAAAMQYLLKTFHAAPISLCALVGTKAAARSAAATGARTILVADQDDRPQGDGAEIMYAKTWLEVM